MLLRVVSEATPTAAPGPDFAVDPKIELAKVQGVGSDMFTCAAAHFHTEYRAVTGEWYTLSFYASAAAGPRCQRIWWHISTSGRVELEAQVTELADINNPPPDEKIVECLTKPKK